MFYDVMGRMLVIMCIIVMESTKRIVRVISRYTYMDSDVAILKNV